MDRTGEVVACDDEATVVIAGAHVASSPGFSWQVQQRGVAFRSVTFSGPVAVAVVAVVAVVVVVVLWYRRWSPPPWWWWWWQWTPLVRVQRISCPSLQTGRVPLIDDAPR